MPPAIEAKALVADAAPAPRKRDGRGFWFGILGLICIAFMLWFMPVGSAWLAENMLANSVPPTDFEYPSTATLLRRSGLEADVIGGQGRGLNCSIPWVVEKTVFSRHGADAGPSALYRQACVAHDLCYRHGAATYGYTQSDCDQMLVRSAYRLCRKGGPVTTGLPDRNYERCIDEARKVYAGVFAGGAKSFRPVNPLVGSKLAGGDASGPAEYEPYPMGSAHYAVPRLVRDGRTTSLIFFLQRPGGARYSRRDWNGKGFARHSASALQSRWWDQPVPPFVTEEGGRDILLWWRRSAGMANSTNGSFAYATAADFARDKPVQPIAAAGGNFDPGASQFYPVPGRSPDGMVHLVAVTEFPGLWPGCGEGHGIQLVHVTLRPASASKPAFSQCKIHMIARLTVIENQRAENVGSYLTAAPALSFRNRMIHVVLLRREGVRHVSEYSELLSGLSADIPINDDDFRNDRANRPCWRLPETDEPAFQIASDDDRLASLSFTGPGGKWRDPDTDGGGQPSLRIVEPGSSDHRCKAPARSWSLPMGRSYMKTAGLHLRLDGASSLHVRGLTDAIILPRIQPRGNGLDVSLLVLGLNDKALKTCATMGIRYVGVTPKKAKPVREVDWTRASHTIPIAGDLNRDGVPDIILADTDNGNRSHALLGIDAGGGRLAFLPPGVHVIHVTYHECPEDK